MGQRATFLFADICGFTALTEAHGDSEAADVAGQLFARVNAMLADARAERVKTIGDAVLVRVPTPRTQYASASRL